MKAWKRGALEHGIEASDPATYGVAMAGLLICALAAGYVLARRASRIDPAIALSAE